MPRSAVCLSPCRQQSKPPEAALFAILRGRQPDNVDGGRQWCCPKCHLRWSPSPAVGLHFAPDARLGRFPYDSTRRYQTALRTDGMGPGLAGSDAPRIDRPASRLPLPARRSGTVLNPDNSRRFGQALWQISIHDEELGERHRVGLAGSTTCLPHFWSTAASITSCR
jgi:hypothetical protein